MYNIATGVTIVLFLVLLMYTLSLTDIEMLDTKKVEEESNEFTLNNMQVYVINLERKPERYNYVVSQLNKLGMKNYKHWRAIDGFKCDPKEITSNGVDESMKERKGIAACAASHISLWKHICENKMDWTLILEDDAHFHPKFKELFPEYWKNVPNDAIIVYPGYLTSEKFGEDLVVERNVHCLHGYLINHHGAKCLIEKLLPMKEPIDIVILKYFEANKGSYVFNGDVVVNGIRPDDYKEKNHDKCMFNGIIYQNREELGSTIHCKDTLFGV